MANTILDFEKPIAELEEQILTLENGGNAEERDTAHEIRSLRRKLEKTKKEIFGNLTPWQRVQLARHPNRPYALDYIERIFTDFIEFHGDRRFADDPAVVGGFAKLNGTPVMVIGTQKGRNTKESVFRNFGCPHPEGYRKALRLMKQAEKFSLWQHYHQQAQQEQSHGQQAMTQSQQLTKMAKFQHLQKDPQQLQQHAEAIQIHAL